MASTATTTTTTTTSTPSAGLPPKPPPPPQPPTTTLDNGGGVGGGGGGGAPPSTPKRKATALRRSTTTMTPTTPPPIPKPQRSHHLPYRRAVSATMTTIAPIVVTQQSGSVRRSALQREIDRVSDHLTQSEILFLNNLIQQGTEEQVATAHCKLLHSTLFSEWPQLATTAAAAAPTSCPPDADNTVGTAIQPHDEQLPSSSASPPVQSAMVLDPMSCQKATTTTTSVGGEIYHTRSSSAPTTLTTAATSAADSSLDLSVQSTFSLPFGESDGGDAAGTASTAMDGHSEGHHHPVIALKSEGSMAGDSVGSERRQEILQQRLQENQVFGQIWKAHESGLALTPQRSRRSIRNNTVRISTSTAAGRCSAIFRRGPQAANTSTLLLNNSSNNTSRRRSSFTTPGGGGGSNNPQQRHHYRRSTSLYNDKSSMEALMKGNYSDNMRRSRASFTSLREHSGGDNVGNDDGMMIHLPSSLRGVSRKPTLPRLNSDSSDKPALQRLLSDSSRKSVSFRESRPSPPHRAASGGYDGTEEPPSLQSLAEHAIAIPRQPHQRSSSILSMSSIPSIHMAHSIRSTATSIAGNSVTPSIMSIPPIQRVNAMRSCSTGSWISTGSAFYAEERDPFHDEASSREEKKTAAELFPRIPSKVEIRPAAPRLGGDTATGEQALSPRRQQQQLNPSCAISSSTELIQLVVPSRSSSLSQQHGSLLFLNYDDSSDAFQSPQDKGVTAEHLATTATTTREADDAHAAGDVDPATELHLLKPDDKRAASETSFSVGEVLQSFRRPVLMRNVSTGEGVEVADYAEQVLVTPQAHLSPSNRSSWSGRQNGLSSSEDDLDRLLQMANSFDETMSFRRMNDIFRRPIRRSISSDAAAGLFVGGGSLTILQGSSYGGARGGGGSSNREEQLNDTDSWQMDDDEEFDFYDPWLVIEDEYENGYGGGGTLPFRILGTSANDLSAQPHVLSPPLMESLQQFLPFSLTGENFWLKYSLVRDGASMHTFLKHARNAKSSILALETTDGEVFGAFTSECWRKTWNFYGNGDSFLWRMRHSRCEKSRSIIDQAHRESEIDVYPFTGENNNIQYCIHDRLAVGGSTTTTTHDNNHDSKAEEDNNTNVRTPATTATPATQDNPFTANHNNDVATKKKMMMYMDPTKNNSDPYKDHDWGYGLCLQGDLLEGSSSPCPTFNSPALSRVHADGSLFEIVNLELWTLTPCYSLEEAEKLELGKLFLEKHHHHHVAPLSPSSLQSSSSSTPVVPQQQQTLSSLSMLQQPRDD